MGAIAVAFVLCALTVVKVTGFLESSASAERMMDGCSVLSSPDSNDAKETFSRLKETAEEIKQKNLFSPPKRERNPVKKVTAIFADSAFVNGKWYKVGDKVGDANIVEIHPTYVKIEWKGKVKIYSPFDVKVEERKKEKPRPKKKPKPAKKKAEPKPVEKKVVEAPAGDDPLAWLGVKLSASLRAKLLEKWNEATDEQKEQFKERWSNMSDEEKQEMVEQWKEHL
jgi:hypothetical protein